MRRIITEQDKKILDKYSDHLMTRMPVAKRMRADLFKAGYTQINGGTVVIDNDGNPPEYIEDDLLDEQRRPYKILVPEVLTPLHSGTRLIVIINGDNIHLLKRENELESLVPEEGPQQAYKDSPHIGHQNQLKHTDMTVPDGEVRISNFFKNYKNMERHRKDAMLFGAGFFGLLGWIFIVCEKNENGGFVARSYVGTSMFDESDAATMLPGQIIYKYTYGKDEVFFGTK